MTIFEMVEVLKWRIFWK